MNGEVQSAHVPYAGPSPVFGAYILSEGIQHLPRFGGQRGFFQTFRPVVEVVTRIKRG